jgi:AsmA protein
MARTRSRGTRRLAVIVLAVVAVIGAVAVALPFLISSDAVKKRISDQITYFTGRTFEFTGDAKLRLFPYLTVRLEDVKLANPDGEGAFISAGQMTGKLEILPLLAGRLEFAEFRLVDPKIALSVDAEGRPNWILDQGVVGTLASKGDSELPADDPSPPSPRADISLGRFLIRGGAVTYSDARNGMNETFSEVNVDLDWRSTVEAARGKGKFQWRGQPVSFGGEINAPLTLLAGGNSPLRVAVESEPATLAFEGVARQFDGMQLEGDATFTVPSVAALAAWLGTPLGDRVAVGAASIAGRLSWVAANLNFLEARLDIDGNVGEGALTATLVDGRPGIQGTLDFARFDFAPIVSAVRATLDEGGAWRSAPVDLPIVRAADLDLRLSAYEAVAGGAPVGPLAATVLAKGGELMVEVGEAHLGGGFLEASLQARMVDGVLATEANLKGDDVAAEMVLGLFGVNGITGTGEVSARVAGAGTTWGELISGLAGTVNLDLAAGMLSGIDVASIPAAVTGDATAVPLQGTTAFDRMVANLTIAGGLVASDDFSLAGSGYDLDLAGKLALAGPTIEARGVLALAGDPPRDVPFLVNGPWAAPSFQPDLGAPLARPEEAAPGNG